MMHKIHQNNFCVVADMFWGKNGDVFHVNL